MIKDKGYLVNPIADGRWYGIFTFDDPEEAITEAARAIKENDYAAAEDLFGDYANEKLEDNPDWNLSDLKSFHIGMVRKLYTPKDIMSDIAYDLDESYWEEYSIDDERPSDYVLSDENVKELNELVYNYLKPLVDDSNFYVITPLAEISVEDRKVIKYHGPYEGKLGEKA